jgi:hypothetical protein
MTKTDTRESIEIIGIQKSECENFIAVVNGKNLIMDEQHQQRLIIFKRNTLPGKKSYCSLFKLHKQILLEEIPLFTKVSMQYIFKKEKNIQSIIFANKDSIFEMNFETEEITIVYTFSRPFYA